MTALALALFAVLAVIDRVIGAGGIVTLELAWSPARAASTIASYRATAGLAPAWLSMAVDAAFIPVYAVALRLWLRHRVGPRAAVLPVIAAGCDAVENLGLVALLAGARAPAITIATSTLASVKFVLLVASLVLLLASAVSARRGDR